MSGGPSGAIRQQFEQMLGPEAAAELSDRQLLERFARQRDEAAFAALLQRHGRLVQGVCRRVLQRTDGAEDVFQATFLVLARRAGAAGWSESVGGWLYGVALQLALNARRAAGRRRRLAERFAERRLRERPPERDLSEVCAILDEEILRLPERYRTAVVLCYLEGRTRDEAARQLGWSLRTLERRLERSRKLLQTRLAAGGVTLSAALLSVDLTRTGAGAAVAASLLNTTARSARLFVEGALPAGGVVRAKAAALAEGALRTMVRAKIKLAAVAVAGALLLTAGAGLLARSAAGSSDGPPSAESKAGAKAGEAKVVVTPRLDLFGDPLPPGALARLGTVRFRPGGNTVAVVFDPDGKTLISAAVDNPTAAGVEGAVQRWEWPSGREIQRVRVPAPWFLALSADGRLFAAQADDNTVLICDTASGKEKKRLTREGKHLRPRAEFSPDRKTLVLGAYMDEFFSVYDLAEVTEVRRVPWVGLGGIAFSPDGKMLAVTRQSTLHVESVADGTVLREFHVNRKEGWENFSGAVLRFSPDGKTLAASVVAPAHNSVRLWDVASGKMLCQVEGFRAAFSPDGKTVATAGYDESSANSKTMVWDLAGKQIRTLARKHGSVGDLAFAPDGKTLVMATTRELRLWDVGAGREVGPLSGQQKTVYSVAWSPRGDVVAATGSEGELQLWDPATGKKVRQFKAHGDWIGSIVFSPDGKRLASAGNGTRDAGIRLWDVESGGQIGQLDAGNCSQTAFFPDGTRLASAGTYGAPSRVWDTETKKEICTLRDAGFSYGVAVAPDGKLVALGARNDGFVRLYDPVRGELVARLDGSNRPQLPGMIFSHAQNSVCFSPDGKLLASGSYDTTVWLWDVAARKAARVLTGHESSVKSVVFSPDGKTLASAGDDRSIRLWDTATGKQRRKLTGHQYDIYSLAFSPDSKRLASASLDGTVLIWAVPSP
jgi:RNA polymerase sigma factor (sigma-70 family)